jgi:hypothetical protein
VGTDIQDKTGDIPVSNKPLELPAH